ncbi:hypothetical protein GQ457_17G009850 [Hibiscus cannabinus]
MDDARRFQEQEEFNKSVVSQNQEKEERWLKPLMFCRPTRDDFHATNDFADMVLNGEFILAVIRSGRLKEEEYDKH